MVSKYFCFLIILTIFIILIKTLKLNRFIYFSNTNIGDEYSNTYLFSFVQIAEIFYILNYSMNFYSYSLSGSLFRSQLMTKYNKRDSRN